MAILERIASKIAGKRDILTPRDWKGDDTAPWTDAKILRPAGYAPEDYICTGCTACDAFPRPKQKRAIGGEPAFYSGAERLQGKGDLLFRDAGGNLSRAQGYSLDLDNLADYIDNLINQ